MRQREGCDGGGKGPLLSEEQSLTLATSNDQVLMQPVPINKELKDKQMTGVGDEGDPMFSIRANGQQHAVAQPVGFYSNLGSHNGGCEVGVSPTLKAATSNNLAAVAQPVAFRDPCPTLTARMQGSYKGQGSRQGGEREFVAQPIAVDTPIIIDRAAFNQGENAQYETRIEQGQTMSSLVAKGPHAVQHIMAVRRLTPVECERLQGFPDNFSNIPWKKKPESPDGPRYKALGNSMAVPCMRWIGERINSNKQP